MPLELATAVVLKAEELPVIGQQDQLRGMGCLPIQQRLVYRGSAAGVGQIRVERIVFAQGIVGSAFWRRGRLRSDRYEVGDLRNGTVIATA